MISSLSFSFSASPVSGTTDTDVHLNVKKRRENVYYKSISTRDQVNLGWASSQEVTPENNLYIADKSNQLVENNLYQTEQISLHSGLVVRPETEFFLLTDQFTDTTDARTRQPLFYKHIPSVLISGDQTVSSIALLDGSKEPATGIDVLYNLASGFMYSNAENYYDHKTEESELYFVKYTLRNRTTGALSTQVELLNNSPVFHQATPSDIGSDGTLNPSTDSYTIEEFGGTHWEVRLPRSTYTALRRDTSALLKLIKSPADNIDNPWYNLATNGKFFATVKTSATDSRVYKYEIAEFGAQSFFPFSPYKRQDEISTRVTKHVIKTLRKRIAVDADNNMHIQVVIKDRDGVVKRAYTTDTGLLGQTFDGDVAYTAGIRSVDSRDGFIDVTDPILDTDTTESLYYFEEDSYEITEVDFNPITNQGILGKRYVFYVVPNNSGRTKTLYYLEVNEDGMITGKNQTDNLALNSGVNRGFFYDLQASGLADFENLSFVNRFTVGTDLDPTEHAYGFELNSRYLVLGEVFTREGSTPVQTTVLDIRAAGGGIKEDMIDAAARRQPEIQWYPDTGAF